MDEHVNNPFVDFKYGDNYASDFHLLRVSNGSRYNNNILPTLTEKTAEVPGGDGMYLFDTYYKQRQFTIDVAFDSVTEADIHNIRNWLNGKEVKPLIFDEQPDRQYFAKVTGSPTLKYIPFDEYIIKHSSTNTGAFIPTHKFKKRIDVESLQDFYINGQLMGRNFNKISVITMAQNFAFLTFYDDTTLIDTINYTYTVDPISMTTYYVLDSADENKLLEVSFEDAIVLNDYIELIEDIQLIYKGEGSIQFTCYDPFAYSIDAYYAGTEVGGNYPTSFTVIVINGAAANSTISIMEDNNPVYSITLKQGSNIIKWDSATGMVSGIGGALPFVGNSMGTLKPGHTYTVNMGILSYYNKYL